MLSSNQSTDLPPENRALEHLLATHAEALRRQSAVQPDDFEFLFEEYGLTEAESVEAKSLLRIAHRLNTLVPVAPSDAFVRRLKNDLTGRRESALILRWRRLPGFYRLAARIGGMTITAGLLLLAGRRLIEIFTFRQRRHNDKAADELTLNTAA
ncbi:MAG TPA: hypothetical protein VMT34_08780 [Aggregatilineales bacterium]|nr:hypothetical protein [Aggregatilineales bacterium]